MTLKGQHRLKDVVPFAEDMVTKPNRYRTKSLPAAGAHAAAGGYRGAAHAGVGARSHAPQTTGLAGHS